ncbi:Crp/Fnr family transcriptional regulator [Marinobacterium sediminicola]|uniref:Cyclic nucleotide-binding protein n=1 Tax=Marinobacterium sediminicola TaxID=518898 RepID=A0ABY1RZ37_9GAMM|nr:Crp/Fnr family transcriptional regulator [Marinobacterium sediminicola]ULG68046.1 Crp/Fnr family transcriptional regulator [Marinobacterium sediminicola]SMR73444.1 cyclic nucleotide-binding protein [Marinobacterium sediminicola]
MFEARGFEFLRQAMDAYSPLSDSTWQALVSFCRYRQLARHQMLCRAGEIPRSFAFVCKGLFRVFALDDKGHEYNKNFFTEGQFPGSMTALLRNLPSRHSLQALEDSAIIEIDFGRFRELLYCSKDLKLFQIHYLEANWLLAKDERETQLVQQDAAERYMRFLVERPDLAERLPQYHIASHLGITPTQLSRIRKKV